VFPLQYRRAKLVLSGLDYLRNPDPYLVQAHQYREGRRNAQGLNDFFNGPGHRAGMVQGGAARGEGVEARIWEDAERAGVEMAQRRAVAAQMRDGGRLLR
jgi:hypothetical protein